MRLWSGVALLCMAPVMAMAQRVSGTVRITGAMSGLGGVVVSIVDSSGRSLARTLTSDSGRYSLPLSAPAAHVRATRIGFRPGTASITRGAAADQTIDLTLERSPVLLETMRVASDASCGSSADGRLVLQVWEQARSALLSSVVAREASRARVSMLRYERRMDPGRWLVTHQELAMIAGTSSAPVAAARSAAQLASSGYTAGTGADRVFFAPDADVLLDEAFGAAHCFGLSYDSRVNPGLMGLTFTPRRRTGRDFVDVTGTLWINPQTPELVRIDYRYTGIEPEMQAAGAGGTMHFRTMPNGVVIIDSWSIMLPHISEVVRRGIGGQTVATGVVRELTETGGYVVSAEWPDGSKWSDPVGGIRGTVREAKTGLPVRGAEVSVTGAATTSDSTGAFHLGPLPPGRYRVSVSDTAFAGFTRPREQVRLMVITHGAATPGDFEVPSRATLLDDLCRGISRPPNSVALLGRIDDGGGPVPEKLRVEALWYAAPNGGATIELTTLNRVVQETQVSDGGRFVLCGIPRNTSHISLRAAIDNATVADTSLPSASTVQPPLGATRMLEWTLAAGMFEAAARGDGSVLSGRVVRNGKAVPDAQVWVVLADTMVTTDSTGRFRIGGLRAGPQIVQVRRLGYGVRRDTVSLRARTETIRDFVLEGVTELDTVRTLGAARKYDNPRLQDFERRRLSGQGGAFVSEDVLRELESISVPSIIRAYVPGARFEVISGKQHLVSRAAGSINDPHLLRGVCHASVFLDGLVIYDGAMGDRNTPPDIASFMAIGLSGIEYYRGGAALPLQFRSRRNDCGTLLLWTRGK